MSRLVRESKVLDLRELFRWFGEATKREPYLGRFILVECSRFFVGKYSLFVSEHLDAGFLNLYSNGGFKSVNTWAHGQNSSILAIIQLSIKANKLVKNRSTKLVTHDNRTLPTATSICQTFSTILYMTDGQLRFDFSGSVLISTFTMFSTWSNLNRFGHCNANVNDR